jgi:O-antigen ligase
MAEMKNRAAIAIFWLMIIAAPLAFGVVDRWAQLALAALLLVGMLLHPVTLSRRSRWLQRGVWLLVALLVAKEFLPASFFGHATWRETVANGFRVGLPLTHNPEPGRAVDALLTGALALLWFLWVRTLAASHEMRAMVTWGLLASGLVLGVVCFVMPGTQETGIYGFRLVPGWAGFGPFPNKNHTACFLAMAATVGCGVAVRAARHRKFLQLALAAAAVCVCIAALLGSASRGGLLVFGFGGCAYALLVVIHEREHKVVAVLLAGALVLLSMFLVFGAPVLTRLGDERQAQISNRTREQIWDNTLVMCKAAPLFGHGMDTFQGVFPFYQQLQLEGQYVLHPESSWLLWLAELGAVPLALGCLLLLWFGVKNLRDILSRRHGFHPRAACLVAVLVLLLHSAWDVPAHRWATAGFALSALAVACPVVTDSSRSRRHRARPDRRLALVVLAIVIYWTLPFALRKPAFSPVTLDRVLARNATSPASVPIAELRAEEKWFPLTASLHNVMGMRLLPYPGMAPLAVQHFRLCDRLRPASWNLPMLHARALAEHSPSVAMHFWMMSIERSGHYAEDTLNMAITAMGWRRGIDEVWAGFVEANPGLLLSYALRLRDDLGREFFDEWWARRRGAGDLQEYEVRDIRQCLAKWGNAKQLNEWMTLHPFMEKTEFLDWARLFAGWNLNREAWELISRNIAEPDLARAAGSEKINVIEARWMRDKNDPVVAESYAAALMAAGQDSRACEVIHHVAGTEKAPVAFRRKAAWIEAKAGHYDEAVQLMLREGAN